MCTCTKILVSLANFRYLLDSCYTWNFLSIGETCNINIKLREDFMLHVNEYSITCSDLHF